MLKKDLLKSEYDEYYEQYIRLIPEDTKLLSGYLVDKENTLEFFNAIAEENFDYRYQPDKWSIKDVLQHMIDNERIFTFRILRVSRNDSFNLPDFDPDQYIEASEANKKTKYQLLEEFIITRDFSINIIKSINESNLKNIGIVSNSKMSANACAFLTLGHSLWHMNTLKEKYL